MVSVFSAIFSATRRILHAPQLVFAPAGGGFEASRAEQVEVLFRVSGHTLGECPSWVQIAVERAEGRSSYDADV